MNNVSPSSLSGPMTAMILAKANGIAHWRELMGPTKTYRYHMDYDMFVAS